MPTELSAEGLALDDFVNDADVAIVMHLAQNVFPLEVDSIQLSDFTECDFPGYAPVQLTEWDSLPTADELKGETLSEYAEFIRGKGNGSQQITAVYVTKQIGDNPPELLWPEYLDIPLLVSQEGQIYRKRFRLNSLADLTF